MACSPHYDSFTRRLVARGGEARGHACAAGQRRAAEHLLSRGADLNWEPDYAHGTPLDAASGLGTRQENVISWLRELGAKSSSSD
jgi:hypothetical protein